MQKINKLLILVFLFILSLILLNTVYPSTSNTQDKCLKGIAIHNGTGASLSVQITGDDLLQLHTIPAGTTQEFSFGATDCVNLVIKGKYVKKVGVPLTEELQQTYGQAVPEASTAPEAPTGPGHPEGALSASPSAVQPGGMVHVQMGESFSAIKKLCVSEITPGLAVAVASDVSFMAVVADCPSRACSCKGWQCQCEKDLECEGKTSLKKVTGSAGSGLLLVCDKEEGEKPRPCSCKGWQCPCEEDMECKGKTHLKEVTGPEGGGLLLVCGEGDNGDADCWCKGIGCRCKKELQCGGAQVCPCGCSSETHCKSVCPVKK